MYTQFEWVEYVVPDKKKLFNKEIDDCIYYKKNYKSVRSWNKKEEIKCNLIIEMTIFYLYVSIK